MGPSSPPERPDLLGNRDNEHEASTPRCSLAFPAVINMRNGLQSDGQDTSFELCVFGRHLLKRCSYLDCSGCSLLLTSESAFLCRCVCSHMCHWSGKGCLENMTAHWACFCAEVTTPTQACLLCCPRTKLVAIFAVDEAA